MKEDQKICINTIWTRRVGEFEISIAYEGRRSLFAGTAGSCSIFRDGFQMDFLSSHLDEGSYRARIVGLLKHGEAMQERGWSTGGDKQISLPQAKGLTLKEHLKFQSFD